MVFSSADVASDGSYEILLDGTSIGTVGANQSATGGGRGGRR